MFYAIKMLLWRSKSFDPVYACILIPKMLWEHDDFGRQQLLFSTVRTLDAAEECEWVLPGERGTWRGRADARSVGTVPHKGLKVQTDP